MYSHLLFELMSLSPLCLEFTTFLNASFSPFLFASSLPNQILKVHIKLRELDLAFWVWLMWLKFTLLKTQCNLSSSLYVVRLFFVASIAWFAILHLIFIIYSMYTYSIIFCKIFHLKDIFFFNHHIFHVL